MSTINPNLASAALSMQNQQSNNNSKIESKTNERSSESLRTPSKLDTSVTLTTSTENPVTDYLSLSRQQTINNTEAVENSANEANETTNGLTYASNLQAQSNFLSNQSTISTKE
ncbi:hypothetical protein THMIRHAM_01060 [Thiomicrorhabdus immobilis]|uniref:Uncharacterized protein n=1 Tax=Thiomicrorhabdus immobilis TaxID=2791037 RepID=A0ABM7MAF6_9GAMM|nr:hypothetical protein [Thiomicrorhabdus immobilis]BCN92321.1 hypothetical protein THMIRHAM_01060 [Thiomicrorhabdus immobilis]